ncbi:MAG: hypothetical protein HY706_16455 [Candidatus Hydrogenedentes bacterium]|nr:hypothetical protein [Candidatus Hydrogenedentota bacterium]
MNTVASSPHRNRRFYRKRLTASLRTKVGASRLGFSLIELIGALAIVTIGLFGAFQMFHYSLQKTDFLRELAIVQQTLQNEIESLRALPYAELVNTDGRYFVSRTPALDELVNVTSRVSIRDYPDGTPGLKEVIVSLEWASRDGRMIEKQLTTLIADKGRR